MDQAFGKILFPEPSGGEFFVNVTICWLFINITNVLSQALLWLGLVKWKRKVHVSNMFEM